MAESTSLAVIRPRQTRVLALLKEVADANLDGQYPTAHQLNVGKPAKTRTDHGGKLARLRAMGLVTDAKTNPTGYDLHVTRAGCAELAHHGESPAEGVSYLNAFAASTHVLKCGCPSWLMGQHKRECQLY